MNSDNGNCSVYVPANINGATDVIIYYPGAGGAGDDAGAMRDYVASNPDKIVIINYSCSYNSSNIDTLNQLQASGIQINNVNVLGHSAGSNSAPDAAANLIQSGYSVHSVVSLDSAYDASSYSNKGSQANIIAQNGTTLIMFDQSTEAIDYHNLDRFVEAGADIVYVHCKGSGDFWDKHAAINSGTINDGLIDFICGDTDELSDSNSFEYEYITYDKEKKQWVYLSKEEAEEKMAAARGIGAGNKTLSDSEYANIEMGKLKSSAQGSNLTTINNISLPHGSTTESPKINIETYKKLFNAMKTLGEKFVHEIDTGIKIAEIYDTLDNDLKKKIASELANNNSALKEKFAQPCTTPLVCSSSNINADYTTETLEGRFLYIYNKLTEEYGYSDAGARAILANMYAENSTLVADRYQSDSPTMPGYGLCQWEFASNGGSGRAEEMVAYCQSKGLDYTTIDGQLAWLDYELQTKYSSSYGDNLYGDLKSGNGGYDSLTRRFCTYYEGPAVNNGDYRANNSEINELFGLLGNGYTSVDTGSSSNGKPYSSANSNAYRGSGSNSSNSYSGGGASYTGGGDYTGIGAAATGVGISTIGATTGTTPTTTTTPPTPPTPTPTTTEPEKDKQSDNKKEPEKETEKEPEKETEKETKKETTTGTDKETVPTGENKESKGTPETSGTTNTQTTTNGGGGTTSNATPRPTEPNDITTEASKQEEDVPEVGDPGDDKDLNSQLEPEKMEDETETGMPGIIDENGTEIPEENPEDTLPGENPEDTLPEDVSGNEEVADQTTKSKGSSAGKAILTAVGVTAAVGGAAGATIYGMKKAKENNEIEDEDEDGVLVENDEADVPINI